MANAMHPYGKFSMGSGMSLNDPDKVYSHVATPEIIEAYVRTIKRDLDKSGITLNQLKKVSIQPSPEAGLRDIAL